MTSTDTNVSQRSSDSADHATRRQLKSLILCGASVRSLAESAISLGLVPWCLDFFEDEDLVAVLHRSGGRYVGRIDSFHDVPGFIEQVPQNVPLVWAGGMENEQEILAALSRGRRVAGIDAVCLDVIRAPDWLPRLLRSAGLGVPRWSATDSVDRHVRWLKKPRSSSGGFGIGHWNGACRLAAGELLQEYIDGVPMSAVFISTGDRIALLGTALQLSGWPSLVADGFRFCGNAGPVDVSDAVRQQLIVAAELAALPSAVNPIPSPLSGVFGLDFILRHGRAWFLELNPRIPASHTIHELSDPGSLLRRHLHAFGLDVPGRVDAIQPLARPAANCEVRLVIWSRTRITIDIDTVQQFDRWQSDTLRVADRPRIGSTVSAGSPVCSVVVRAASIRLAADEIAALEHPIWEQRVSFRSAAGQLTALADDCERHCANGSR